MGSASESLTLGRCQYQGFGSKVCHKGERMSKQKKIDHTQFNNHMKVKSLNGVDRDTMEYMRGCPKKVDPVTWELMQEWGCAPPMVEEAKKPKPKGPTPQEAQQEAMNRKRAFVETAMGKETRRQTKLQEKYEKAKLREGKALVDSSAQQAEKERQAEAKRLRWKAQKMVSRVHKNKYHAKAVEVATGTGLVQGKQSNLDALAKVAARLLEEQR